MYFIPAGYWVCQTFHCIFSFLHLKMVMLGKLGKVRWVRLHAVLVFFVLCFVSLCFILFFSWISSLNFLTDSSSDLGWLVSIDFFQIGFCDGGLYCINKFDFQQPSKLDNAGAHMLFNYVEDTIFNLACHIVLCREVRFYTASSQGERHNGWNIFGNWKLVKGQSIYFILCL